MNCSSFYIVVLDAEFKIKRHRYKIHDIVPESGISWECGSCGFTNDRLDLEIDTQHRSQKTACADDIAACISRTYNGISRKFRNCFRNTYQDFAIS